MPERCSWSSSLAAERHHSSTRLPLLLNRQVNVVDLVDITGLVDVANIFLLVLSFLLLLLWLLYSSQQLTASRTEGSCLPKPYARNTKCPG